MTKKISLLLVCVMIISLLSSCDFLPDDIQIKHVKFYVDGELYATNTAILGQATNMPVSPTKPNHIFVGWFVDTLISYEYDFSLPVLMDMDLYAYFVPDAISITNNITLNTMPSVVTIMNKGYNTAIGGLIETESATSQGSGVIVDISGGYCFVLTNCHVVERDKTYSHQKITVEDVYGNEYEAAYYKNNSVGSNAFDPEYDLALIYFKYDVNDRYPLTEIVMADDPKIGDFVVSLGAPEGQRNAITYGEVLTYQKLNAAEGDSVESVKFDVIYHSALITHGSSGGPLLNADGELVGLNFAGFEESMYGCAIPLSKILEFLYKYVYVK